MIKLLFVTAFTILFTSNVYSSKPFPDLPDDADLILKVGQNVWDHSFDRGCGSCHDISSNPQLVELIQDGSLTREKFFEVTLNGRNGMPKADDAIMAIGFVAKSGFTLEQAINATYSYLKFLVDGIPPIVPDPSEPEPAIPDTEPEIKANGSSRPIGIPRRILSITVAMETQLDNEVDWWLVAETPVGWFYYNVGSINRRASWINVGSSFVNLKVTHQGKLISFPDSEVLNIRGRGLPAGTYIFYFGVDSKMNGILDFDDLVFDKVVVGPSP